VQKSPSPRSERDGRVAVIETTDEWERRIGELWAAFGDDTDETEFVASLDRLVAELPPGSAIGSFERACAFDSTGHSDRAVPLYAAALERGLRGVRRRRAVIQMSSSLRNLGEPQTAVDLLRRELDVEVDALTPAVQAVLALALTDIGREREAVSIALTALAGYLPRYNRSMARYARELLDETD
jgi:tetratricopeptide (TPR) repeat protein